MLSKLFRRSGGAFFLLLFIAGHATAGLITYTLTFTGTSTIGPGQFAFDSGIARNTTIANVVFPSFAVSVGGVIFTPQSADDDAVFVNGVGLVTALDTDINPPPTSPLNPEFLQLMPDLSYQLFGPTGNVSGQGTYRVTAATSVPEPAFLAPVCCLFLFGALLHRQTSARRSDQP